jgi:hypothetical protein
MDKKFYFPLNYKFEPKLLGIIDYKSLLPVAIFSAFIIMLLYINQVDFFISFGIVIIITLPPILLLSAGINGQPAVPFIISVIKFLCSQKLYIYKK